MADRQNEEIVIVGCGLAGCMMGMLLAKRGYDVKLFERSPDWRIHKKNKNDDLHRDNIKRSINLALSHRGRCALKRIGLEETVLEFGIPMKGRAIHTKTDSPDASAFQPYDENDSKNCIYSVSREKLNTVLLESLEACPNVKVFFNHSLMHIDKKGAAHFAVNEEGKKKRGTYNDYSQGDVKFTPRVIIGADGAYSTVRESMLRLQPTNFTREYITHGYKELLIPAKNGKYALNDHNALHIWPRDDFMMIALPNPDKSFTATIFAPLRSEKGVAGLFDIKTKEKAEEYMKAHFPDSLEAIPNYQQQFLDNPTSPLVTVRVSPWNFKDKVVVLGDSAHAMVPFYGQGMNSAFEDCLVFDEVLQECKGDLSKAVPNFAKKREASGNAIAKLSMGNYLEMRHHTGSTFFLLQKKLEGMLNFLFPNAWIPLYKMVTFTRIPYDEVIEREERQANILKRSTYAGMAALACVAAWLSRKALIKSSL